MKSKRTIPINLEDWLRGFRSSLESHPFHEQMTAGLNEAGEQASQENAAQTLSVVSPSDNVVLTFAV